MNIIQKLLIIFFSLILVGIAAALGLFAAIAGAILLPFIRSSKNNNIQSQQNEPEIIENTIDAEFTRIKDKPDNL